MYVSELFVDGKCIIDYKRDPGKNRIQITQHLPDSDRNAHTETRLGQRHDSPRNAATVPYHDTWSRTPKLSTHMLYSLEFNAIPPHVHVSP